VELLLPLLLAPNVGSGLNDKCGELLGGRLAGELLLATLADVGECCC